MIDRPDPDAAAAPAEAGAVAHAGRGRPEGVSGSEPISTPAAGSLDPDPSVPSTSAAPAPPTQTSGPPPLPCASPLPPYAPLASPPYPPYPPYPPSVPPLPPSASPPYPPSASPPYPPYPPSASPPYPPAAPPPPPYPPFAPTADGATAAPAAEPGFSPPHSPVATWAGSLPPDPTVSAKRGRLGWILASVGAVVVVAAFFVTQAVLGGAYEADVRALERSVSAAAYAQSRAETAGAGLRTQLDAGQQIVDHATADLADAEATRVLAAGIGVGADVAGKVEEAASASLPAVPTGAPFWLWELIPALGEVQEASADAQLAAQTARSGADDADDAGDALGESAIPVFASTAEFSPVIIEQNLSAQATTVIAFRRAAEEVPAQQELSTASAAAFLTYIDAAGALRQSQASEMAEKQGPLLDERLAVEDFARSLSGGVLLDFDWARLVNGYGERGSMGGEARWWYEDGGHSTIRLSDSVAEEWPNARSKALVAHEVGHAITAKCIEMIDEDLRNDRDTLEAWATAWAIGLGFTNDANGVQAYGYPSQEMIDLAKGCR